MDALGAGTVCCHGERFLWCWAWETRYRDGSVLWGWGGGELLGTGGEREVAVDSKLGKRARINRFF